MKGTPRPDPLWKRGEDLILGSLALLLFSPLMVAIALAIKLTSPGPVFFRQRRHGLHKRPFLIWKFRTMTVCEDGEQIEQAKRNDPRVTPVGAFLRRTSLDELPQLFNVLKGEMSLVGPRPHAIAHDETFKTVVPRYEERFRVKPGMTGWAQVNGYRGEIKTLEELQKRIEYDLYYVENRSFGLDLKILFLTVWRGFVHPNAY